VRVFWPFSDEVDYDETFIAPWLWAAVLAAQPAPPTAASPVGIVLTNDKLELTIGTAGGRFSRLVLREGEPLSPLRRWGISRARRFRKPFQ